MPPPEHVVGAVGLLILARLLRRWVVFTPATARWALAAGLLMLVPSPFGLIGIAFSLASAVVGALCARRAPPAAPQRRTRGLNQRAGPSGCSTPASSHKSSSTR